MKKVPAIVLFFIFLPTWASDYLHQLSEYDGSTPILGLFDEPLPPSFYQQDYSSAFMNGHNYTTVYDFSGQTSGQTTAYLINEEDLNNDIVISAVDLNQRKVKNFLVRVPALDSIHLNISPLSTYDQVFMMSLGAFQVQINAAVGRHKMANYYLDVIAPTAFGEPNSDEKSCSNPNGYFVTVSNLSPSSPGSVKAWAALGLDSIAGVNFLRIEYPIYSGIWYHTNAGPYYSCSGWTTDVFYTYSPQSTRYIRWSNIYGMFGWNFTAKGECQTPTSGSNSCFVAGTSTLASWSMKVVPLQ